MAGLTLGFAVLSAVVGPNRVLRAQVVRSVSASLPGLIDTGNGSGAISPDALRLNAGLNIAGVVAVVVLALSATSCMAALRTAVRAMFEPSGPTGNMLTSKLRELAGFAAMAGAVLVSAVLTTALTGAVNWTLGTLGLGKAVAWAVTILGVMVSFIVDAPTFVLASRFHGAAMLGRDGGGAVSSGRSWHLGVTVARVSSRVGAGSRCRGSCGGCRDGTRRSAGWCQES
jgi:membrane protein